MNPPQIGSRIALYDERGTVRFVGQLEGQSDVFLGIEWDDVERGKHSGTFKGKQYFQTIQPGAGSFVRLTADGLCDGRDFLSCLREKYVDQAVGDMEDGVVAFGGNEAIKVETVGWSKIHQKQKNVHAIKEVGLAGCHIVCLSHQPFEDIHQQLCINVEDLDLSKNLFVSLQSVAEITGHLSELQSLRLNHNRFNLASIHSSETQQLLSMAFSNVSTLSLSHTKLSWDEFLSIESFFPSLKELNFGFNAVTALETNLEGKLTQLKLLNLEHNHLQSWQHIQTLANLPALEVLWLNDNQLSKIEHQEQSPFKALHTLYINANNINDWQSVHQLNLFPHLTNIRIKNNPILDLCPKGYTTMTLLGRLSKVVILNKSQFAQRDRFDAEYFYLESILHQLEKAEAMLAIDATPDSLTPTQQDILKDHPLYFYLRSKYQDVTITPSTPQNLKKELVELIVSHQKNTTTKAILASVTIRTLKSLVTKWFKVRGRFQLQVNAADGRVFLLDDDLRNVGYYGLGPGDVVEVL